MLEEPLCEVGVGVGQPQQLVGQHRAVLLAVGHPAQARVARVLHNSDLESSFYGTEGRIETLFRLTFDHPPDSALPMSNISLPTLGKRPSTAPWTYMSKSAFPSGFSLVTLIIYFSLLSLKFSSVHKTSIPSSIVSAGVTSLLKRIPENKDCHLQIISRVKIMAVVSDITFQLYDKV